MNTRFAPIGDSRLLAAEFDRLAGLSLNRFGEYLVAEGIITPTHLQHAMTFQKRDRERRIGDILVEMKVVEPETVAAALARRLGIPAVDLSRFDFDPQAIRLVSKDLALRFCLIPCMLHQEQLVVASPKPLDAETLGMLRFAIGRPVRVAMATKEQIESAIDEHYPTQPPAQAADDAAGHQAIVNLLESTILYGVRSHAAEISIRPEDGQAGISFRIDGETVKISSLDRKLLPVMIEHIKSIGRIAGQARPGEGAAWLNDAGRNVELGFSVIAGQDGEQLTIRIIGTA